MLPHWKHFTLGQRVKISHGLGMDPTFVSKEIKRDRVLPELRQGVEGKAFD